MKFKFILQMTFYTILLFALINVQGCYTTSQGDYIRSDRISGSEREINKTIVVKPFKEATIVDPSIVLYFEKEPIFQVTYLKKYNELKKPNALTWSVHVVSGIGTIIAISMGSSKNAPSVGVPSVLTLLGSFLFVTSGNSGKVLSGENEYKEEIGEYEPLEGNYKVRASFENNTKEYFLDEKSNIKINLINDLGINKVKKEKISISVYIDELNFRKNININSDSFLHAYITTKNDRVEVVGEVGNGIEKIGQINKGEEFKLIHQGKELWKLITMVRKVSFPQTQARYFGECQIISINNLIFI